MNLFNQNEGSREVVREPSVVHRSRRGLLLHLAHALLFALALAVVVVPELPHAWFIALNPVSGEPYRIIRGHVAVALLDLLWALDGWRSTALAVRVGIAVVLAGLLIAAYRRPSTAGRRHRDVILPGWTMLSVVFLAGTALCYLLRLPHAANLRFGDGAAIPGDIDRGMVFPAELLTCYAFYGMKWVMSLFNPAVSTVSAVELTSALSGGLFAAGLFLFSSKWCRSFGEQAALTLGAFATGASAMFLGYIETTQLELAVMGWFFAAGAASLGETERNAAWTWEVGAVVCISVACLSHAAGILLIPACVVFLMDRFDARRESLPWMSGAAVDRRRIIAWFLIVLVPYVSLLAQPFFFHNDFGNITGGADNIMFVPLSLDYAHPVSPLVSYSMFSWWHAADIFSALLVAAPAAPLLLLAAAGSGGRPGRLLSLAEKKTVLFIGIAAAACLAVPLLWNHDFGMWGDWNLAATYIFPFNCFAWTAFLGTLRISGEGFRLRAAAPFLFLQLLFAAGFLLQLL